MLTPRLSLARRVTAALDASPSRIPVLVGGCGSGRTTLLQQLRDRIGRSSAQYIDVERTATTPERFQREVIHMPSLTIEDTLDILGPIAHGAPGGDDAREAEYLARAVNGLADGRPVY